MEGKVKTKKNNIQKEAEGWNVKEDQRATEMDSK